MKSRLSLLIALVCLVGCSSLTSHQNPAVDLTQFKRFYVEHRLTDDHGLDHLIVNDLKRRGYEAACGPLTMMPDNTQVLVVYEDRWNWDFKSYLIELDIKFRDARKEKLIAFGTLHHPSPVAKEPATMIHQVLNSFFK